MPNGESKKPGEEPGLYVEDTTVDPDLPVNPDEVKQAALAALEDRDALENLEYTQRVNAMVNLGMAILPTSNPEALERRAALLLEADKTASAKDAVTYNALTVARFFLEGRPEFELKAGSNSEKRLHLLGETLISIITGDISKDEIFTESGFDAAINTILSPKL